MSRSNRTQMQYRNTPYALSPEMASLAARVQQRGDANVTAAEAEAPAARGLVKIPALRVRTPLSVATYMKRLRTQDPKAKLTAAEKRQVLARQAAFDATVTPTANEQMVAQGNVGNFAAELVSTNDQAFHLYQARAAQMASVMGHARANETWQVYGAPAPCTGAHNDVRV